MIRPIILYHSLNKVLLLAVGIWPYHQSKFTQFQFVFFSATLSASIIVQLILLIKFKCTSDLIVKVMSSVSFFIILIIKYILFHFNLEAVKNLFTNLQHVLNDLKNENEIAILEKYNFIAKCYTIVLTALGVGVLSSFIIAQFWSDISNIIVSVNTSQSRYILISSEYFIDQEKYFYWIVLHISSTLCIGIIIMVGIGTILVTYIQHTCGIFRIASYRIEHAVNINILQNTLKNKILMMESIIQAINIHRQAIKLSKRLVSTFDIMFFCFTGCLIACLALNLFQLLQVVSSKNIIDLFLPFTYATTSFLYIFISNYIGQNITDHNNHLFVTAYNIRWYKTPLHIQKIILFLLQNGTKKFTLKVGGMIDGSIENFAMVIKTSISYFTVMYSTR
ncbi:uncharacterized protein LOC105198359 [Solenopsis invicta]|uniref:uncharacterized protein LOC105198359 n=1 Tax=Solenopsis invicta TaxID=13686 RepID=UPI00193E932A|nr:uncharacterized protein LOC105198359 [Solenopsis invicta]